MAPDVTTTYLGFDCLTRFRFLAQLKLSRHCANASGLLGAAHNPESDDHILVEVT